MIENNHALKVKYETIINDQTSTFKAFSQHLSAKTEQYQLILD
jgi:hypothetical protein